MKTKPFPLRLLLLFLLTSTVSIAQAQPVTKRILGSFLYQSEVYNYEFAREDNQIYTFRISTLEEEESDSIEYAFSEFSKDVFAGVFARQMEAKYEISINDSLKEKAIELFFIVKARFDFLDDEPVTAYLILKKDYVKSILKVNTSVYYNASLSNIITPHYIKRVSVETEDGVVKNVTVQLVDTTAAAIQALSPRKYIEFKNQFPISISGKFDAEKFSKINLYCFNCNGIEGLLRYVKLSDILALDIVLENDKDDYSPANRTFTLSPSSPIAEMKKEKRSRLVELSAFTDFVGLDQEQPNGLIQIEAKRKININTKYHLFRGGRKSEDLAAKVDFSTIKEFRITEQNEKFTKYKLVLKVGNQHTRLKYDTVLTKDITVYHKKFMSAFFNMFGSIEPKLLFSKLEENNRFIDSTTLVNGKIDPVSLYQYQLASFGVTGQVFKIAFPQLKFTWNVANVGAYWYRTRLSFATDSTDSKSVALNSHYWLLGTNFSFKPDTRWGATLGFDYIKQSLWNQDYRLANSHALLQPYVDAYIKTDDYAKLFFRFRWTFEDKNLRNNFVQIQLGYSLSLFGGNPGDSASNSN